MFNERNHIAMQSAPQKEENNTTIMAHKTKSNHCYPNLTQLSAQPPAHILYHHL